MSRLRLTTVAMSVETGPVVTPKRAPWRARCATFALQISFLLGRQAMFGQEPPIQRRSTTAARRPDCAMCQASSLPLLPLPRIRMSNRSGRDMIVLRKIGLLLLSSVGGSSVLSSLLLQSVAVCGLLGAVAADRHAAPSARPSPGSVGEHQRAALSFTGFHVGEILF